MQRNAKRRNPLDLVQIQAKLEKSPETRFWRGLEELANTPEYRDFLECEFPHDPRATLESNRQSAIDNRQFVNRREALKLMAASAALAGLTACTKLPTEKIVPYAQQRPEDFVPNNPIFYATAMPLGGYALGLLAESHMGRPTKVEGNPNHPAGLGAANVFAQASILDLYDPDRAQVVIWNGHIGSWSNFLESMNELRAELLVKKGAGLRFLTGTVTSPTLVDQFNSLLGQFPQAKWHQYEPCGRDSSREGAKLAFGEFVNTIYHFDQADIVVSLDADFLSVGPAAVRYAHDFIEKRRVTGPESGMNRLYVAEATPTITGAMADHRLRLRASEIEALARALAGALGIKEAAPGNAILAEAPTAWIAALARDLELHRGACLIVAGDDQPPSVHALAHVMNDALGSAGKTVTYTAPVEANPQNQRASLRELVAEMREGQVETLIILGVNPVYSAPADLHFRENLLRVKTRIHLSPYEDETAVMCHWHIPEAHYLETWSDGRAYDGTITIMQPLISPLYNGKSAHEFFAVMEGRGELSGHDVVRGYWQRQKPDGNFEAFWQQSLNDGVVAGTALPPKLPKLILASLPAAPRPSPAGEGRMEVVLRPDPTVWDGSFANNGWLQELPKPLTKLTWDNAALLSPAAATELRVTNGDFVKLRNAAGELDVPVRITPGQADESITLHLGYGRWRAGRVGNGLGFNAYRLSASGEPGFGSVQVQKTGRTYQLVSTQQHHIMGKEGQAVEEESVAARQRGLVPVATLAEFRNNPDFAREEGEAHAPSLYPGYKYDGYAWGMSIDLNSCIGCNACVVACQSENNIPVVGKDQVARGREMHWIRVDTYFQGGLANPAMFNEVVPCMQCENAPCEYVCPVGATVHSPEGLNEMVYNRCVGTRYCSNNCPYKVRHFNFYLYADWYTPSLKALRNPDVSVRSRGVMEKCTYCIQRINAVKFTAEKEDRQIRDGEIIPACQQTCPTQAIVFGNINDPGSKVAKLKAQSRNYSLLADLNTRPRTTYLARLRNPNPEMKE